MVVTDHRTAMGRSELLAEIVFLERSEKHWRGRVDELQARCTDLLLEARACKRVALEADLLAASLCYDNDRLRVSRALMSTIVRNSGRVVGCCPGCLESIPPSAGQAPPPACSGTILAGQAAPEPA